MEVNNFAPAEYGGYVAGADSGGGGGGSSSGMIGFDGAQLDKSYNELLSMLTAGEIPRYIDHFEDDSETIDRLYILTMLWYNGEDTYNARFINVENVNNVNEMIFYGGADTNMILD